MNSVDISTEMVDPASGEYDDMPHIAPGNIESFTGRILDNVRTVKEEQLISGKFRFRPDDVVYGKINPQLGKYFYASVDGLTSADAYVFKGKNGIRQKFLFSMLQTSDFFKYSVSVSKRSGMPKINRDELNAYAFLAPSEEEQDKIGNFLLEIDHLITLHHRKFYLFIEKDIFAWEQRKLGEYLNVSKAKNRDNHYGKEDVLSVSGDYGIINQIEFQGRSFAGASVANYGVVNTGDVVYTKSPLSTNPYGIIKANKGKTGIVSTLYAVYKPRENVNPEFVQIYFELNSRMNNYMQPLVNKGAKNDMKVTAENALKGGVCFPKLNEQDAIVDYFKSIDHLITLHQRKLFIFMKKAISVWEQRKLGDIATFINGRAYSQEELLSSGKYKVLRVGNFYTNDSWYYSDMELEDKYYAEEGDLLYTWSATFGPHIWHGDKIIYHYHIWKVELSDTLEKHFAVQLLEKDKQSILSDKNGSTMVHITKAGMESKEVMLPPNIREQAEIGKYLQNIDHLITLHQRKQKYTKYTIKYTKITLIITKEKNKMPELEKMIEEKLIEQLVYGKSQWIYRDDLKTEADLWKNFKYILEQNNKDRLNGEPLSDTEFEQVKNQLQFSSFYKAGEWLVGENGKVQVHVQRDTERLHLVVMNHEHIAGGSSVYEVINQYSALGDSESSSTSSRDRRFDVTLMINGLPMIHIELKNKQHSYMDAFWQIKKYIGEGKFTGIFSAVQMFVVSNGVDTKYFAAASDTELNPKFMSGWVDQENNPVPDYIDFAKSVLRIPEAHEMIARYTVLDEDAKRLILLRPYQIHAIESIREASKTGKSGYVWHTTGSGKTLTSYKATRNLLMDIPAIDKAIFLIDRKDLDTQTTMAFQAYANNDLVDVDETDNVNDLKKKLKSDDRQVIVTTIQKMQILISKRLKEGTPEYSKIKNLKIAYVVDECHRAVTPKTKRELERFFGRSLWYGFTGTPRFGENPYPQLGDLPRTTEELYGKCLHKYTIQNAIHDKAVLGFQVEHNGPKNVIDETDASAYDNETHMLRVLDIILNKSYHKLGFQNGKGKTYEGLLTTSSIQLAQKYYELLSRVKRGETDLVIDEKIKQVLPDFPKFAITYSVTENEEGSHVNQQKMQQSLDDYNGMFGTKFELSQIQSYNGNLNKRLARKDAKFASRNEQLDLVIVVDRLLTGFDAPCMSTIFIDRQPMGPHDLIQAFSRTNRIFDTNKTYGQIVTFQAPKLFKEGVDNAIKLYSAGSTEVALVSEWDEVEPAFRKSLAALRVSAATPEEVSTMSMKEKRVFAKMFQTFDRLFAQLKSFTRFEDSMLEDYGITETEYEDYVGRYKNVMEEIKLEDGGKDNTDEDPEEVDPDYELMAYSNTKIDYEYIIYLIQNIVTPADDSEDITPEERQKQIDEVKQYVEEMRKDNAKVADIMSNLISEIEVDENKYKGQSILNIVENMKRDCIDRVISDFCYTWYASKEDVMYAALHYRNGEIPNESVIKGTIDYTSYKAAQEKALPKFKYYKKCMDELRKTLDEEIKPLLSIA